MYSLNQLHAEIGAKIVQLMRENAATLSPVWITQALMADHPDVQGVDADFHLCCSRMAVRKEATQQINRIANVPDNPRPAQLILDGFDHLQQYYVIGGKEGKGIRIDLLSDGQLLKKADEYAAMGNTCFAHAAEIRRYVELRQGNGVEAG